MVEIDNAFSALERDAVFRAIFSRRDMRNFVPGEVPEDVLSRLLLAAHHAPSVGLMQPWNFIVVRSLDVRRRVFALFERERESAAVHFDEPRRSQYTSLKLEGILESALNLCVTCDPTRNGPNVLGRSSVRETDLYSVCCAVQNFWLAARAEGIGVGWVSILRPDALRPVLGIPPHVIPVAYLCVGQVEAFPPRPYLEAQGWERRREMESLVFHESWGETKRV